MVQSTQNPACALSMHALAIRMDPGQVQTRSANLCMHGRSNQGMVDAVCMRKVIQIVLFVLGNVPTLFA